VHSKAWWNELATVLPSKSGKETYKFLGSVPPMREWGTGRKSRALFAESYDVVNQKYELTLEVDRDEIADDQLGQIRVRVQEMAQRAGTHKDALIGALLINGESAGFNAYDGKTFFATDHASGKSGDQSNILTPSIVDKDNPTTAEFRAALGSAIARMLSFKDDQGEPMSWAADGLIAVVPPSMLITASEAINATLVNSTTNILQGAAKVTAFPHLSDTDTWYLLKTNVAVRPFILQDRAPIELTAMEQNSEEGFKREKFLYGVRARYAMTYGYWQYALKVAFATA
jgi:phage major head subunit gpT-like protein